MSARGPAWEALGGAGACTEPADAYEAGIADERERGMRRAARIAVRWHDAECAGWEAVSSWGHVAKAHLKARDKCLRIARGEPAFTTARAFGGREVSRG